MQNLKSVKHIKQKYILHNHAFIFIIGIHFMHPWYACGYPYGPKCQIDLTPKSKHNKPSLKSYQMGSAA